MILRDCQPILRGCKSPEPDLHEIITAYYLDTFGQEEAEEIATEYLDTLDVMHGLSAGQNV